jgi:hypothetical protein
MRVTRAYIVVPEGTVILGGYTGPRGEMLADEHRRCSSGTVVVPIELLEVRLPSIREDLAVDEWSDEDTPRVVDVETIDVNGYSVSGEIDTSTRRR